MIARLLAWFRPDRGGIAPIVSDADGLLRMRPHARLGPIEARHRGRPAPPSEAELRAAREANRLLGLALAQEDALRAQMSQMSQVSRSQRPGVANLGQVVPGPWGV
jgi:hypothetical protein